MRGRFAPLLAVALLFPVQSSWASVVGERPALTSFAQLPIEFEANQGQHDRAVRYLARARGYQMYLTGDGAVMAFNGPKPSDDIERSKIQLRFSGANKTPELIAQEPSEHKTNYLIGDAPSDYRTDIPNYARVLYRQVYPGIDVAFYGKNGAVEYDLMLEPGADPDCIKLDFSGAERLELNESGDLQIHTSAGVLVQHKPVVFQERDGKREVVAAEYRVLDSSKVRLQLATYDRTRTLTIDPVLSYSTYIGGGSNEDVNAVAVDASGSVYITGTSMSTDWPSVSAYQSRLVGYSDAVVAKLNSQGTGLVYSTYIGGRRSNSRGDAIAVDASGNAYIVGYSSSDSYPTTNGAYSAGIAGGGVFLTKLNAAGSGLLLSTYLKIAEPSAQPRLALDSAGNTIVAGETRSLVVTTAGALQTANPSPSGPRGYITKLNSAGSAAIFSTYLGGSSTNGIRGVALDSANNIYVVGYTDSADFPISAGAYQGTLKGDKDAFVAKINPTGTALIYSTFLGGAAADYGNAIAVDASGRAYVTGDARSIDFPVVNGSYKAINSTSYNVSFISNLSADGSSVSWSTLFGGRACVISGVGGSCLPEAYTDIGTAIAADSTGTNIYVAGYLRSIEMAGFVDPIQTDISGRGDAFVVHLQADPFNAGRFNWRYATRLGGTGDEKARGIAIDPQGNTYVAGYANTTDFPTTQGVYRVASAGFEEGFVIKLSTLSSPVMLEGDCPSTASAPAHLRASTALNVAGNMIFKNGATTLATVPIVGGLAAWSGPLPAGVHLFTATRASDGAVSRSMLCQVNQ